MAERKNYSSGAPWESIVGYSRAVQVGNLIELSGTTAVRNGLPVHPNDAYLQAKEIFAIAKETLEKAGASFSDVVRTRMYVTNIKDWEAVGKAHGEVFESIRPATTLVEVSAFVDPAMLVEIEFSAIINS